MCPGPGQGATGQSPPPHLLPVTCSPHPSPARVLVPLPGSQPSLGFWGPLGGGLTSRRRGSSGGTLLMATMALSAPGELSEAAVKLLVALPGEGNQARGHGDCDQVWIRFALCCLAGRGGGWGDPRVPGRVCWWAVVETGIGIQSKGPQLKKEFPPGGRGIKQGLGADRGAAGQPPCTPPTASQPGHCPGAPSVAPLCSPTPIQPRGQVGGEVVGAQSS